MAIQDRDPDGEPIDYVAWAKAHVRKHPTHDRFRLVTSKGFRVTPRLTEDDVEALTHVCGELKVLPNSFIAQEKQETGLDWSDVTVACALEPHGDGDHVAKLLVDGEPHGEYRWSASPTP
ncbi:hypothetical protein ACGFZQ_33750 [Streptomyces sp. NPDC048254]|uniref:hypothetical protein n=1 Tax=Streptomyces sp. NPDC048254 TaxID=3365525 RepID=UPI00372278CA